MGTLPSRLQTRVVGLLLMLLAAQAWALSPARRFEQYVVDQWSIEHGLPQVAVLAVAQDPQGWLWIGTQQGLARFDGVNFDVLRREDAPELPSSSVDVLHPAPSGVWFGTPRGGGHVEGLTIRRFRTEVGAIHAFATVAGTSYVATAQGLYRIAGVDLVPVALAGTPVHALLGDDRALLLTTAGEVHRLLDGRIERLARTDASLSDLVFRRLVRHRDRLLLGTTRGLYAVADGRDRIEAASEPRLPESAGIEALHVDSDLNLWISTVSTLYRESPLFGLEVVPPTTVLGEQPWVTVIHEDRERNLWFGSMTASLVRAWNGWASRVGRNEGLTDPFVWSLKRDAAGTVWIGSNSGIARYAGGRALDFTSTRGLPSAAVYHLDELRPGHLLIGTRSGLFLGEPADDGRLRVRESEAFDPLKAELITSSLVFDGGQADDLSDARFWVGTLSGLQSFEAGGFRRLGPAEGLAAERIRVLDALGDGGVLIGTESGLWHWDGTRFTAERHAGRVIDAFISAFATLPDGRRVVGTLDAGLYVGKPGDWRLLGATDGLPQPGAHFIATLGADLWVATAEGLYRLPIAALDRGAPLPAEVVLSSAGRFRGSQPMRCCNGGGDARGLVDGNQLLLPSIAGLVVVHPEAIGRNEIPPLVAIAGVRLREAPLPLVEPLVVDEAAPELNIAYAGLSFQDPRSVRFRYRLDPYDADWREVTARREAVYGGLGPGRYRFRVQAYNNSDVPSASEATWTIIVPPRWHQTWGFRLLAGMVTLGLIFVLARAWQASLRTRAARLEALVEQRTQEVARVNERLRRANQSLLEDSLTDALTGLRNRRALTGFFDQWRQSRGPGGVGLVVFLIDLDHFKQVNDTWGHPTGDEVLKQLAERLRVIVSSEDLLLRWGGEEFMVIQSALRCPDPRAQAELLRRAIADTPFQAGGQTLWQTGSVGFAGFPLFPALDADEDPSLALELADAALYRVKTRGRNGICGLEVAPYASLLDFDGFVAHQAPDYVQRGRLRWVGA